MAMTLMAALAALAAVTMPAMAAPAPGDLRKCESWRSYTRGETRTVELSGIFFLGIGKARSVNPAYGGELAETLQVRIVRGDADDDRAKEDELPVRGRREASGGGLTFIRLPVGAWIEREDTGEKLPHAEFLIQSYPADGDQKFREEEKSPITCLEVPGSERLASPEVPGTAATDPTGKPLDLYGGSSIAELGRKLGAMPDGSDPVAPDPASAAPAPVGPPLRGAGMVCDAAGKSVIAWNPDAPPVPDGGLVVAGVRSGAKTTPVLNYNAAADDVFSREGEVVIRSAAGQLDPLRVEKTGRDGAVLRTFARPLQDDVLDDGTPAPAPPKAVLNVAVFGDGGRIALSGLGALDRHLRAVADTGVLRVTWYPVAANGELQSPQSFVSFAELDDTARRAPGVDVDYSSAPALARFTDQLAGTIVGRADQVDMVIWVLEGVMLPDEAPKLIADAIGRISREGNVPRFEDGTGEPRRWLHVVAGHFAQSFSGSYLRGPIIRADPSIGDLVIEPEGSGAGGKPRRFLSDDQQNLLGNYLMNQFRRNRPIALPSASGADRSTLVVDAKDAYERIGIVVETPMLEKIDSAARGVRLAIDAHREGKPEAAPGAGDVDISALLLLGTDERGVPKGFRPAGARTRNPLAVIEQIGLLETYGALTASLVTQIEARRGRAGDDCQYTFLSLNAPGR